jgi:hypothetical protein
VNVGCDARSRGDLSSFVRDVQLDEFATVDFELVCDITDIETIAVGRGIRDLPRLRRLYGKGYRRKMKGNARI